ncbi:chaperonin 10-like protein [Xylogone sp. PMI_703]|nr:chaperonin 10-like protein [Xylogone sp. PMI_703]
MAVAVQIPSQMKAQFLDSFNTPYVLRSTPVPTLQSDYDLLIRITAASYCHTDYVLASGALKSGGKPSALPHVGSHEFAGTIVVAGPAVTKFKQGQEIGVAVSAYHACGTCDECLSTGSLLDPPGYSPQCPNSQGLGIDSDGGFREYAVVDSRQVTPIPEGMTGVDTAPLMCAGLTIYTSLRKLELKPGDSVGILGAGGGLGHLGIQFAANMGLKVFGIENALKPLELAESLNTGAVIVNANTTSPEQLLEIAAREDSEGKQSGLDAVIILPESQAAFDYGMKILKKHGKCMLLSFPEEGFHLSARDIVFRDIQIMGSVNGSNKMLREMMAFASKHNIRARTKTFPLAGLNQLVEHYLKGEGGKLVVDMSKTS